MGHWRTPVYLRIEKQNIHVPESLFENLSLEKILSTLGDRKIDTVFE